MKRIEDDSQSYSKRVGYSNSYNSHTNINTNKDKKKDFIMSIDKTEL